jgi:hypothetical protein
MRGRIFISVLLGLSLLALPAFAHRHPREKPGHESPGKPDRPGLAMERSRPGEGEGSRSSAQAAVDKAAHSRGPGNAFVAGNNARGQKLLGRASAAARTSFNEAGEDCGMGKAAAQVAVFKAAHSRAAGNGFDKANNARGQKLLGRGAAAARTSFNEAGEAQGMGKAAAQIAIFKAAHSRATGNGFDKVNNAKGKSLIANRTMSLRSACNEADECSVGKAGAQAIIFKAAHSRDR